jgi:hypothetical protein
MDYEFVDREYPCEYVERGAIQNLRNSISSSLLLVQIPTQRSSGVVLSHMEDKVLAKAPHMDGTHY